MGKDIFRRLPDGDYDYDGEEDEEVPDEGWGMFNDSFNW